MQSHDAEYRESGEGWASTPEPAAMTVPPSDTQLAEIRERVPSAACSAAHPAEVDKGHVWVTGSLSGSPRCSACHLSQRALDSDEAVLLREVDRLRGEVDELLTELDGRDEEARERWIAKTLDETSIKAMEFRAGMSMELEPAREMVAHWVGAARGMLGSAENYSETPIEMVVKVAESPETYAFTLQRVGKLAPHQARQRAEAERDQLAQALAELTGVEPSEILADLRKEVAGRGE